MEADKLAVTNNTLFPEPTYLANLNAHPRDKYIFFDEPTHIYTVVNPETGEADSNYTSVTTVNHSYFPEFNEEEVLKKMRKSPKFPFSEYANDTDEEIKVKWQEIKDEACDQGTEMHYRIECFYNNMGLKNSKDFELEMKYFAMFYNDHKHLIPYRTEWRLYDTDLKIAGSIDMIFKDPNGKSDELVMYDWKRCKKIEHTNPFGWGKYKCIEHLPDSNYWHYCLQLNTYKYMIEKHYGMKVTEMYIISMHPNNENKSYLKYEIKDLSKELEELMRIRRRILNGEDISDELVGDPFEENLSEAEKKVKNLDSKSEDDLLLQLLNM